MVGPGDREIGRHEGREKAEMGSTRQGTRRMTENQKSREEVDQNESGSAETGRRRRAKPD